MHSSLVLFLALCALYAIPATALSGQITPPENSLRLSAGLGAAAPHYGFAINGHLVYTTGSHAITMRGSAGGGGFILGTMYIFEDAGLLYGREFPIGESLLLSVSGGVGTVRLKKTISSLVRDTTDHFSSGFLLSFPVESQLAARISNSFAIMFAAVGNINAHEPFLGFTINAQYWFIR